MEVLNNKMEKTKKKLKSKSAKNNIVLILNYLLIKSLFIISKDLIAFKYSQPSRISDIDL